MGRGGFRGRPGAWLATGLGAAVLGGCSYLPARATAIRLFVDGSGGETVGRLTVEVSGTCDLGDPQVTLDGERLEMTKRGRHQSGLMHDGRQASGCSPYEFELDPLSPSWGDEVALVVGDAGSASFRWPKRAFALAERDLMLRRGEPGEVGVTLDAGLEASFGASFVEAPGGSELPRRVALDVSRDDDVLRWVTPETAPLGPGSVRATWRASLPVTGPSADLCEVSFLAVDHTDAVVTRSERPPRRGKPSR